ncbi:hypothetical protein [Gordonibacter massiliensis (ex Traore et al. 2017)]|uniref:hypothetical protein n=1 Tax=Gordonibacter massiliensis (ex Traore et al. 2017) TaxID=1841863 RepID=UPI001C8BA0CF|nr:hypothetical protein [Gordonibacter massiliensis (ex Traore et al. 2017)]MBX9032648.1 hypothetical protein [Gordonibacter massiliensis (ex Traore et al. 2017)]
MKTNDEHRADLMADPDDRRHGTARGAGLMCPCPACSEKRAEINAERRERDRKKRAAKVKASYQRPPRKRHRKPSKDVCTVDAILLPMMGKPSVDNEARVCCICGAPATDRHHIVRRGAGKLVRDGREVAKPTIRLCGDGNAGGCHGKAHAGMLHFRWVGTEQTDRRTGNVLVGGHWEFLETDEPTKYQTALETDGWRPLC